MIVKVIEYKYKDGCQGGHKQNLNWYSRSNIIKKMFDKVIEYKYKASCQNDQAQIETKSGCPLKRQPIQHKLQMITKTHLVVEEWRQLVKHKHAYFDFACYTYKNTYSENAVQVLEATIPYMYELNSDTAENNGGAEREMRLLIHQSIVGGVSQSDHDKSWIYFSYHFTSDHQKEWW